MTSIRRHTLRAVLAGALLAVAACGTGSESQEESRNAAMQVASSGKAAWGVTSTFFPGVNFEWDPISKRSVGLTTGSTTVDGLYVGAAGFVDGADPWNSAVPESMPIIHGMVKDAEPDGSGGWYLAGNITGVGNTMFDRPSYIVRIDKNGQRVPFNPLLRPMAGQAWPTAVKIWLDDATGTLVASTYGIEPPAHFTTRQGFTPQQLHMNSIRVLDRTSAQDLTFQYVPSVSEGFVTKNVVDGQIYITSQFDADFGTRLDGVSRRRLETINMRTKRLTDFGTRFHASVCTAQNICITPTSVFRHGSSIVVHFELEWTREGVLAVRRHGFVAVPSTGDAGRVFARLSHLAQFSQLHGAAVIGDRLYVSSCMTGDPVMVRAYDILTGSQVGTGHTPTAEPGTCTDRRMVRIGDDLYLGHRITLAGGLPVFRLTRLSPETLTDLPSTLSRTVTNATGQQVTQNFDLDYYSFAAYGESSHFELEVSEGRIAWPSEFGIYPTSTNSRLVVSDDRGSQIEFDDGLAAMNRTLSSDIDVHDGWLYAFTYSLAAEPAPIRIMRWNLATLELDRQWSLDVDDWANSFVVGDSAILVTYFRNREEFTSYDIETGFRRFSYQLTTAADPTLRAFAVDGDVVWTSGGFNTDAGQHAVARLNMTDGSIAYSDVEAGWCAPANLQCHTFDALANIRNAPLVEDEAAVYTIVSGKLARVDKATMATTKGAATTIDVHQHNLAISNGTLFGYDRTARQIVRFSTPSMEQRGGVGPILPLTGAFTSIISSIVGTESGLQLLMRNPATLTGNTVGSGAVAMERNGSITLGLRKVTGLTETVTAMPVAPAVPVAPAGADSITAQVELVVPVPIEPTGRVSVTSIRAAHRQLVVGFTSPFDGATHRVVDVTGKSVCSTTGSICTVKNLSPAAAISLSVLVDGRPETASEFTTPMKPSFVAQRGATVRLTSVIKPGKAKATWTVRGGCRLNAGRTAFVTPKKAATCTVRAKGGKGRTAYDFTVRVAVK